jgi:hypothetical protein
MFGAPEQEGSVSSMAIAIRSNSQISYPILSAGAFTATLSGYVVRRVGAGLLDGLGR